MDVIGFHEAIPGYFEDRGNKLWLKLGIKGSGVAKVFARVEPDNEEFLFEMLPKSIEDEWQYYEIEVDKCRHINQTDYLFKILTDDDSCWLGSAGIEPRMPRNIHMFRYSHDRRLPFWSASQVFYQIFPERFANGDDSLSPKENEYRYLDRKDIVTKQWGELPDHASGGFEFFGGDLIGAREKLSYLNEQLGITAIYLNPVFTSQSSHKYDTVDYMNVDPHFGGNEALQSFVESAHEREIKVVLDAVINHTSIMHPWFQAALAGDETAKKKYVFSNDGYESWKNHKSLPTLDYSNPEVNNTMILNDDSVIRHWLRPPYNIDGWRMDVIHMLGEGEGAKNNAHYLRQLRNVIKEENNEALLLGEHFFEATDWLQGDQEDCAMNYFGFAHPVRAFFAGIDIALDPIKIDAAEFSLWMREARARISFDHQLLQFNQLDSHDTPRFLSMLKGDKELLKAAIAFLMTYIGTPCLYYGTEIGLTGDNDPGCRGSFPWSESEWDMNLFEHSQRWIELRKTFESLSSGAIVDVYAQGDVVVFARVTESQQCLIALNKGQVGNVECDVKLPHLNAQWKQVEGQAELSELGHELILSLPAKSVTLWVKQ